MCHPFYDYQSVSAPFENNKPPPVITMVNNNVIEVPYGDPAGAVYFEDILPKQSKDFSCSTLGERLILYNYVNQNVVDYIEGEFASLKRGNFKNLLRYFKITNPFPINAPDNNTYSNPWINLKNLELYTLCYPITTTESGEAKCKEGSWGLYLRKYKLMAWEANLNTMDGSVIQFRKNSSIWRDIDYYIIIRDKILLNKVCPNFILMYTYFRCPENLDELLYRRPSKNSNLLNINIDLSKMTCPNLYEHLLVITEGLQYTLTDWMQNKYHYFNHKRYQINSSVHSIEVWKPIFFMIWSALIVLKKLNIYIPNFSKDNILIRDLLSIGKDSGYWIYIINNKKYYIWNYGYVPLIDLSPKPLIPKPQVKTDLKQKTATKSYNALDSFGDYFKCYSPKFFDDPEEIIEKIKDHNNECQNINNISSNWEIPSKRNSKSIPEELFFILNECNKNNIKDPQECVETYMRDFLHNRIGTRVRTAETIVTNKNVTDLKKGELVAYLNLEDRQYYWGLYEDNLNNNVRMHKILCCNRGKPNIWYHKQIPIENISVLADSNKEVQQDIISGVYFSSKYLLETYNISNYEV